MSNYIYKGKDEFIYKGNPNNSQGVQVWINKENIGAVNKKMNDINEKLDYVSDLNYDTLLSDIATLKAQMGRADRTNISVMEIHPGLNNWRKLPILGGDKSIIQLLATPDNGANIIENAEYIAQLGVRVITEGNNAYIEFDKKPTRIVYLTIIETDNIGRFSYGTQANTVVSHLPTKSVEQVPGEPGGPTWPEEPEDPEGPEVDEFFSSIFDTSKMYYDSKHGYIPILSSTLSLEVLDEEIEDDFYLKYTLTIDNDEEILTKLENNEDLHFDISCMGLSTNKIKLFRHNEIRTKATWIDTGDYGGLLTEEETGTLHDTFFDERVDEADNADYNITPRVIYNSAKVTIYDGEEILREIDLIGLTLGDGNQIAYRGIHNTIVEEGPQDGGYEYPELYFKGFLKHTNLFGERLTEENGYVEILFQENFF